MQTISFDRFGERKVPPHLIWSHEQDLQLVLDMDSKEGNPLEAQEMAAMLMDRSVL